jgi:hypothetical protein
LNKISRAVKDLELTNCELNKMLDEKEQAIVQLNFKRQEEINNLDSKYTKEQKEKHAQFLILQNKLNDFEGKNGDLIRKLADNEQAFDQLNFKRKEEKKLLDKNRTKEQNEKDAQFLILQKKLNDSEGKNRDLITKLADKEQAINQFNFKMQEEINLLVTKYTKEQREKHAQFLILQNKLNDFDGKYRDLINKLADKEQAIDQLNFKSQEEIKLLNTNFKIETNLKDQEILVLKKKQKELESQINEQNSRQKYEIKIHQNSNKMSEIKSKSTSLEHQNNITSSTLYQDLNNDSQIKINNFQRKQTHSKSHQKLKFQGI